MKKFCYDLHIHSCLSPCADNESTPNSIAGMAYLSGIDIAALTDHNTAKNCPAFFEAAERYGIVPIAGMELTTSEDIHIVCLFESLDSALKFDAELQQYRFLIKNKKEIFGDQLIMNSEDEVIGEEEHLLSNATRISIENVKSIVEDRGGVCYPAHIDRDANGIIAILGTLPDTLHFDCIEIHFAENVQAYTDRYALYDSTIIVSSDAHYLTDISENNNFFELECEDESPSAIRHALFERLRSK